MIEPISINEGNIARIMSAKRLKTAVNGGGSCMWVRATDVVKNTLSVSENGVNVAADSGVYCWDQVNVNVSDSGSVSGKGQDGKPYVVSKGGDGSLSISELPATIVVDVPPTVTTYSDGETIDLTGMVVKAYLENGELWTDENHPDGIIPLSELMISPTIVDAGSSVGVYTDGAGINAMLCVCATMCVYESWEVSGRWIEHVDGYRYDGILGYNSRGWESTMHKNDMGSTYLTRYDERIYAANASGNNDIDMAVHPDESYEYIRGWYPSGSTSASAGDGVFNLGSFADVWTLVPESSVNPSQQSISGLEYVGGQETVTVQWARPGDYEMLETGFEISVVGYGGASGGGGQAGESGTGRND